MTSRRCCCGGGGTILCDSCDWPEDLLITFSGFSNQFSGCDDCTVLNDTFTATYGGVADYPNPGSSWPDMCLWSIELDVNDYCVTNINVYITKARIGIHGYDTVGGVYYFFASHPVASISVCSDLDGYNFPTYVGGDHPCAGGMPSSVVIGVLIEYP